MIKIHVAPPSPRAFKVLAVARHLGIDFELRPVNLAGGEQLGPEFTRLNPNQKMPVLEEDGFVLWESNAIAQYLAEKKPEGALLPSSPRERADVTRWQFWDSAHWDPACATLVFERLVKKLFGQGEPNSSQVEKGEAEIRRFGGVLNASLAGRRFLCGDRLSVADFAIGSWLNYAEPAGYPIGDFREINRWYAGLTNLPAWRESIVPAPF